MKAAFYFLLAFTFIYFAGVLAVYFFGFYEILKDSPTLWAGLNKFWDVQSPFNLPNAITIVIALLPGIGTYILAKLINNKYGPFQEIE